MEAVDFFEMCNKMMLESGKPENLAVQDGNVVNNDIVKATGFDQVQSNYEDEFSDDTIIDEFSEDNDESQVIQSDISSDHYDDRTQIKQINAVQLEFEYNDQENFATFAITYVAHGDPKNVLNIWNSVHSSKCDKVTNLDDFLVAFAYEHFAVELNIAEVRTITVDEIKKRFQKIVENANSNAEIKILNPVNIEIRPEENDPVKIYNQRMFALLSRVTGKKYEFTDSFNQYAMQSLLLVYKYPLRKVSEDIGDTILLKTSAGFKILDAVQLLAGNLKLPRFNALAVQELNNKAGLLFYEATDTTIDSFMDFSQKSENSFVKWAKTDMRLSKGCERWNLVRLIHTVRDTKAKKKLFMLFDVPFLDYWKIDRAISYCLDKFPEFKDSMQGDDVIEKLKIISKYTHIESKTVFLLRFLEMYLCQQLNATATDLKKIDCNKITVELDSKRRTVDLRSFIAGVTSYKEMYGRRLKIQIENNDEICVIT